MIGPHKTMWFVVFLFAVILFALQSADSLTQLREYQADPNTAVDEVTFARHSNFQTSQNNKFAKLIKDLDSSISYLRSNEQDAREALAQDIADDEELDTLVDVAVHLVVLLIIIVLVIAIVKVRARSFSLLPFMNNKIESRIAETELATATSFGNHATKLEQLWVAVDNKIDK